MSGFSRGAADAMLEGRAASAESSARLAQAEADSLQRKVWRLERELREAAKENEIINRLLCKTVGEREGFKALTSGFSKVAREMLKPEDEKELYRGSILAARHFVEKTEGITEELRENIWHAWTSVDFSWNEDYPLYEIAAPGIEPASPKPPAEIETITRKLFLLIPYRMYFVEHRGFHRKKKAQKIADALRQEYDTQMEEYKAAHVGWTTHREKHKRQHAKIAEYSLSQ